MTNTYVLIITCAMAVALSTTQATAQDGDQKRVPQQQGAQIQHSSHPEQIYGSELMTEQERNEYHERMRNMKSDQEQEAYRSKHHEKMQQRATEQGMKSPEEVPGQGKEQEYGKSSDTSSRGKGGGKGR